MNNAKIDKKYFGLIWAGLIVASLIRSAYGIYDGFMTATDSSVRAVALNVIVDILLYGLVPAWLCYCCASIFWSMSFKRGFRSVPRSDFMYLTMLFTMGARLIMGFVEIFAILDPVVYTYTSVILDVTVLSAALYAMYFAVLVPTYMNPVEANATFGIYAPFYLLFQGLHTGVPCLAYFIMSGGASISDEVRQILGTYGYSVTEDNDTLIACIVAMSVYAAFVLVSVALSAVLSKRAKEYKPEPKVDNPFDDGNPSDDGGKVFDEFDI